MKDKIIDLLQSGIKPNIELALQLYKGMIDKKDVEFACILIITADNGLMMFDTYLDSINYDRAISADIFQGFDDTIYLTIKNYDLRYKRINEKALSRAGKIYYFEQDRIVKKGYFYIHKLTVNNKLNEHITRDLEVEFKCIPFLNITT